MVNHIGYREKHEEKDIKQIRYYRYYSRFKKDTKVLLLQIIICLVGLPAG